MRNSRQHFPDYEQRPPVAGTSAHLASAHYCLYLRITPVSQSAIRRSMRKNVRATAPAADSGTVRLRRGHVAPLIGL
jgi:hypothetical protein